MDIGRVGIIGGAGWLGSAIAKALVAKGAIAPGNLTCSYRSRVPEDAGGITWTADNAALVANSDVIVLSVRPEDWPSITVEARDKLVISVMAGVPAADISSRLGTTRVARALPNAAAEIGFSYTPFFLASDKDGDGAVVAAIFGSCGEVDVVREEWQIDYFTAMSGSGAAFPALLAEAMMNDAIKRGVAPETARRAAQHVLVGAGRLQELNGACPTETVRAFVDYRGTTAAGIIRMREDGFETAVSTGLDAAYRKARSLSAE